MFWQIWHVKRLPISVNLSVASDSSCMTTRVFEATITLSMCASPKMVAACGVCTVQTCLACRTSVHPLALAAHLVVPMYKCKEDVIFTHRAISAMQFFTLTD